jgi:hypothetical protein
MGSCVSCKFWFYNSGEEGVCVRYPPVRTEPSKSYQPRTFRYDTCGEYKIRLPKD